MEFRRPEVEKLASLSGHSDCVYALACTQKSGLFYSSGADGLVVRWDLNNIEAQGKLIAKIPTSVYALSFVPETQCLLIGQNFEGLHLIDTLAGRELRSVKLNNFAIFDLRVANEKIYALCGDGTVFKLDYRTFRKEAQVKYSLKSARCLAFAPNSNTLAVGYSDQMIRILDADSLQLLHAFEAHSSSVFAIGFVPGSNHIISGGRDARLKVWDTENGYQILHNIPAHTFAINDLDFSPDGQKFVTGSMDKSVKIWDSQTFKLLKVIDKARHAGHGTSVNSVRWTDYQENIISCSDDRTISVWKVY